MRRNGDFRLDADDWARSSLGLWDFNLAHHSCAQPRETKQANILTVHPPLPSHSQNRITVC
jgi:hypothetical protein